MANVNDTNNTARKLERQWELLANAEIDDRDRQAIKEFVRLHRQGVENCKPNTLYADLSTLRNASDRADTALVDMDMSGVRELFGTLTAPKSQGGYGLDPDGRGMFGYKRALINFFRWLDNQPDFESYPFYDNIDLPSRDVKRVDEDELLTEEEVQELKEAAKNERDKALIEFLGDSAARTFARFAASGRRRLRHRHRSSLLQTEPRRRRAEGSAHQTLSDPLQPRGPANVPQPSPRRSATGGPALARPPRLRSRLSARRGDERGSDSRHAPRVPKAL